MMEKLSKDEVLTLSDADISSRRSVSRRSVLGTLGLGAGVAVAAALGMATSAEARDLPSRPRACDRDPGGQVDYWCYDVGRNQDR